MAPTRSPASATEATRPPAEAGTAAPGPPGPPSAAPQPAASGSLAPGTRLGPAGRYRITGLIGQGGFAETFAAVDTELFDGPCVVKRLRSDPQQPPEVQAEEAASLAREASLLVTLKTPGHPNIPEVYAFLETERCLVMKYITGTSLQAMLARRSSGLPEAEALRYAAAVASALAYLHSHGVQHLDVKPANVLCDSSGRIWLIDFGIGRSSQTPPNALALGTPGYTPPEQWRSKPEPCSDVYALAVTLYVLLTNQLPALRDVNTGAIPDARTLRQLLPGVRPELIDLLQRAGHTDPARRPSAAELLDELQQLQGRIGVPQPAQPPDLGRLFGREEQLGRLHTALAQTGNCAIVGMPGVGKTALAVALARQQPAPEQVFWHTFQADDSFEGLLWSLAAFLAWNDRNELWAWLKQAGTQMPPPQVLLEYLLEQLHDQPGLLCLDDMQQVVDDPWIMRLLRQLATPRQQGPRLLLTTRRALPQDWPGASLVLPGLEATAARELLARAGAKLDDAAGAQLLRVTEANPQLLLLAANALQRSTQPASLIARLSETEHIERYLLEEVDSGRDEDERALLRAVAVLLGAPGRRELLEEMLASSVRRPLRRLIDQQLIIASETAQGQIYSQHAMVQAFYYGDLAPDRRRELHRRAAIFFAQESAAELWAARHYAAAGDSQQAAAIATRDIWGAVNRGQAGALLHTLQQIPATDLTDDLRIGLLLAQGELAVLTSNEALARAAYTAAFSLLEEQPTSETARVARAQVCHGMAALLQSQEPLAALEWIDRGLNLPGAPAPQEVARLCQRAGAVLIGLGANRIAEAMLQRSLATLPADTAALRADILTNLATIAWLQGDLAQGEAQAVQALQLYERSGQHWKMATIRQNLGLSRQFSGDWQSAAAEYGRAMEAARSLGSILRQAELELCLGTLTLNQGDHEAAGVHLNACIDLARQHQLHEQCSLALSNAADLHLRAGRPAAAATALDEAARLADRLNLRYQFSEIARMRAELLLAQGDVAAALSQAQRACAYAREQDNPREEGMALRVLGQVQLASRQIEQAQATFGRSIALLDEQDPYEAARSRLARAAPRNDAASIQMLRQAAETFARLGAQRDLTATLALLQESERDNDTQTSALDRLPVHDRNPGAGNAGESDDFGHGTNANAVGA